jgi:molybdate transport system substrate-binding protein
MRPVPAGLCALALGLAAGAGGAAGEELLVAAAASLREPLLEIARSFEVAHPGEKVRLSFGASSALAAQIRAGGPVDVLLSADEEIPLALEAEGLVIGVRSFASNRLVVIAADRVRLERPGDLLGPEVRRVALPAPAVPLGHYARAALARAGLLEALAERRAQAEDARATLAAVERGSAQAAIVYQSDARLARAARVAFAPPDSEQPRIADDAARLRETPRAALAERFLSELGSALARAAFRAAGFAAAPPAPAP